MDSPSQPTSDEQPIKPSVLYVDDESHNLTAFKSAFRRDFEVYTANSGKEGMDILAEQDISVIITDQRMPEMTGTQMLEQVNKDYPDPIRILLTGYSAMNAVVEAINVGKVYYYMQKPWDEDEVKIVVKNAEEVFRLRRENKELTKSLLRVNKQLEFMLRQKLLS